MIHFICKRKKQRMLKEIKNENKIQQKMKHNNIHIIYAMCCDIKM